MTSVQTAVSGAGNRLYADVGSAAARLEVLSESGMGSAEVIFPAEDWPSAITLRLHLRGLEALTFRCANWAVRVSVSSAREHTVTQSVTHRGAPGAVAIEPGDPHWMAVHRTPAPGTDVALRFDVAAPAALFADDGRPFSFDWLDFYR